MLWRGLMLCLSVAAGGLAWGVDLVRDGEARCVVVAGADVVEQHAASELALYLGKITGADVAVVAAPQAGRLSVRFVLAPTGVAAGLPAAEPLRDDGFLIAASSEGVTIASRKRRGFLYGVCQILRDAGMWWLYPGEEGEVCPKTTSVAVSDGVRVFNPYFSDRHYRLHGGSGHVPDTYDWQVRNGLQVFGSGEALAKYDPIATLGGHVLTRLLVGSGKLSDAEALLAEHPELFGLRDGERVIGSAGGIPGRKICQPCTSNPETVRRMIASARQMIAALGDRDVIFTLCNDDHGNWCQCEACTALDPPEEAAKKLKSTRWWTLVNQVSEALPASEYPRLTLNALAYQHFTALPTGVRPDPRVRVTICPCYRCYAHSLTDTACEWNAERYLPIFQAWSAMGMKLTNFEYYCDAQGPSRYYPMERAWVRDLKFMHSIGMCGAGLVTLAPDGKYKPPRDTLYRSHRLWYSQWQAHWLTAFFHWNIDADYETVWNDVSARYYGAAWPLMREYRLALEKALADSGEIIRYGGHPLALGKAYSQPGAGKQLLDWMEKALVQAEGDPVAQKRILREREYLEKNWVEAYAAMHVAARRRLWAGRRELPLLIDGRGDDAVWASAPVGFGFQVHGGEGVLAEPRTAVRLLYDDDCLYLLIEAERGRETVLRSTAKDHGTGVFHDSHLEIFLGNQKMQEKYYMLAFNWEGKLYQAYARDAGGNNDLNVDAKAEIGLNQTSEMLTAEVRVPWRVLGTGIDPDVQWRLNVARSAFLGAGGFQLSSLCSGHFHGSQLHRPLVLETATRRRPDTPRLKIRPKRESAVFWPSDPVTFVVSAEDFDGCGPGVYELSVSLQETDGSEKAWRQPFIGDDTEIVAEGKAAGTVAIAVELWRNGAVWTGVKGACGAKRLGD